MVGKAVELSTGNERKYDVDANRKQHYEEKVACWKISERKEQKHSTLRNLII